MKIGGCLSVEFLRLRQDGGTQYFHNVPSEWVDKVRFSSWAGRQLLLGIGIQIPGPAVDHKNGSSDANQHTHLG